MEDLIDAAQRSFYSDIQPKYATSQRIKDILAPFKETLNFTTLVSGNVIVTDTRYLDLLDLQIYFLVSNRTIYYPVQMGNEDVRAQRLNSQIDPVTVTSPIGEQVGQRTFRLYPAAAYNGNITYLRRPIKPVFGYSTISGRIIVYNSLTSTQLEWEDSVINQIIAKALSSIGINLTSTELQQYAEMKASSNYVGVNML